MAEENKAFKMLLESLDNQQKEIVRLQEREIELLSTIIELESQRREQMHLMPEKIWEKDKSEEVIVKNEDWKRSNETMWSLSQR